MLAPSEEELHRALVSMHIHVTRSDVRKMVKRVDLNSDGYVSLEEFSEIFSGIPNATLESVARAWVHSAGSDVGSDALTTDELRVESIASHSAS